MKANVGGLDKLVRLILVIVLIIIFLNHSNNPVSAFFILIVAGILLLTAVLGTCPLYSLLGITSRKKEVSRDQSTIHHQMKNN